jgi:glutamate-ammonia-ligase adenylyltransferase
MTFSTIFNQNLIAPLPANDKIAGERLVDWLKSLERSELHQSAFEFSDSTEGTKILHAIFGNSPFLSSSLTKDTEFFLSLISAESEHSGFENSFEHIITRLQKERFATISELMKAMRVAKRQVSLLIAIADMTQSWKLEEITWKLSIFADACIQSACDAIFRDAHFNKDIEIADLNTPCFESGLVVLAMGKLGAYELNYSSDIDLIIFYNQNTINYTGRKNEHKFFIDLAQKLATMLEERTKDGYVFRTDLRLRPDPGSTSLAVSLQAAEIYYETLGQNWERAAMIKSRTVVGDANACNQFEQMIRPYVWRKTLDFASIQDIHSIKRQIDAKHGNIPASFYGYHVKLGHGGIREIEFFVQTQQLIFGGRRPYLQTSSTCNAMHELVRAGEISQDVCDDLIDAYRFHRTLEHRLQMIDDQQTHSLPSDEEGMQNIAIFMGYEKVDDFLKTLTQHVTNVKSHYAELFNTSPSLAMDVPESYGNLVFTGSDSDPETVKTLKRMGFANAETMVSVIRAWHHGRRRAASNRRAREILTELMPVLIVALSKTANPDTAFKKFDEFISQLPGGVQIFSLFYSNPRLLNLIADVMGSYPRVADDLTRNPSLLDYVLAPEFYNALPKRKQLKRNIDNTLALEQHDMETVLNVTRGFTNDRRFRITIQFIENKITNTEAIRNLSRIADIVLETFLEETKRIFEQAHGCIPDSKFTIVALGKLGGKELTFKSDLDLVFIYDVEDEHAESDGKTPLTAAKYFTRLSRRFMTSITAMTNAGSLYDIDLRLRPSGNDGPVASNLKAFEKYYGDGKEKSDAWTWEFMALTRARVISNDEVFRNKINKIIRSKLRQKRDHNLLTEGVLQIHQKLKEVKYSDNPFAVKTTGGGLMDVEYISQYLQLKHAHENSKVLHPNTRRALAALHNAGFLSSKDHTMLRNAEQLYSRTQTSIRLTETDIPSSGDIPKRVQKTLSHHTKCKDFAELKKKLVTTQKNVQKLLQTLITKEERS